MTTVFVQFTDATVTTIAAVFCGPQDADAYPHQAEIDERDPRYRAYVDPTSTLAGAVAAKAAILRDAYAAAIATPVSFTSAAGVTKLFQTDAQSISNVSYMIDGFALDGTTPVGFYWKSEDNTKVAFTYADLKGLANVIARQAWAAFAHLQERIDLVLAAATVAAVQQVAW